MKIRSNRTKAQKIIVAVVMAISLNAFAQTPMTNTYAPENLPIRQEGKLVSVELVWGQPLRIYVVGKKEAEVNLSTLELTVRRIQPTRSEFYTAQRQGDHFVVPELAGQNSGSKIEIKTLINGKSESLNFQMKKEVP